MAGVYRFRKYVEEGEFRNRFATDDEIKQILRRVDLTADELPLNHGGAAFISDTKEAYVDDGDYHTLILGATGSMKTRLFILPTVFTLALAGENMVISDPKGEIFEKTSGFLKQKGYQVNVLNLRDLDHSDCWNPFEEAFIKYNSGNRDEGLKLSMDFIDVLMADSVKTCREIYWPMAAKQFLQGAVEVLVRGAKTPDEVNISSILPFFSFTRDSSLRDFTAKLPPSSTIRQNLEGTVLNGDKTMAGIIGQASGSLSPFTASKLLQRISAKSTIDLHAFKDPNKKCAIYIIVPDEITTFHFFVASFIKQLYSTAISDAFFCSNGALPRRLNFILDEFANIPRIPEMATMITAARSRNIRFYLVVQSDNQLQENYGDESEVIKTNCLNWIYLTSKEVPLIKQVQKMTGSTFRSSRSKPLISYYELTAMRKVFDPVYGGAQALILISRSKPFMTFLPDISRYKQFATYPSIGLPDTDPRICYFDVANKAFNLPPASILETYSDLGSSQTGLKIKVKIPKKDEDSDDDD